MTTRAVVFLVLLAQLAAASHYETLGVNHNANWKIIKRAYEQRSAIFAKSDADGGMKALEEAMEVLRDPHKRKEYDESVKKKNVVEREERAEKRRHEKSNFNWKLIIVLFLALFIGKYMLVHVDNGPNVDWLNVFADIAQKLYTFCFEANDGVRASFKNANNTNAAEEKGNESNENKHRENRPVDKSKMNEMDANQGPRMRGDFDAQNLQTPEPVSAPRTPNSHSRYGFCDSDDDADDYDESYEMFSSPSKSLPSTGSSKHGFYDSEDDSDGADDINGNQENKPNNANFNKGSRILFASPKKIGSMSTKRFEFSFVKKSLKSEDAVLKSSMDEMLELHKKTELIADNLKNRDYKLENNNKVNERRIFFSANKEEHDKLLKNFEEEEKKIQMLLIERVKEIEEVVHGNGLFDLQNALILLEVAKSDKQPRLPIEPTKVREFDDFISNINKIIEDLDGYLKDAEETKESLIEMAKANTDDAQDLNQLLAPKKLGPFLSDEDVDELDTLLSSNTAQRLRRSNHPKFVQGWDLLDSERMKENAIKLKKEERQLPRMEDLEKVKNYIKPEKFKTLSYRELLNLAIDCSELMLNPKVKLSYKHTVRLWKTIFSEIIQCVKKGENEKNIIFNYSILVCGLFSLLEHRWHGNKKSQAKYDKACELFVETLGKEYPLCRPLVKPDLTTNDVQELKDFNRSLKNIIIFYGSLISMNMSKPLDLPHAWTWLVHIIKFVQKAVLKICESDKDKDKESHKVFFDIVADSSIAMLTFLKSSGKMFSEHFPNDKLFSEQTGILSILQSSLNLLSDKCSDSRFYEGVGAAVTPLKEFLRKSTTSNRIVDVPEFSVDHLVLKVEVLTLLSENRQNAALTVMRDKEFEVTKRLLDDMFNRVELARLAFQQFKCIYDCADALATLIKVSSHESPRDEFVNFFFDKERGVFVKLSKDIAMLGNSKDANDLRDKINARQPSLSGDALTLSEMFLKSRSSLLSLTEKRRKMGQEVLLDPEFRKPEYQMANSLPYKISTLAGGVLNKEGCVGEVQIILKEIMQRRQLHLLPLALSTVATSIISKCTGENFNYENKNNSRKMVDMIHGITEVTKSPDFILFIQTSMRKHCPFLKPNFSYGSLEGEIVTSGMRSVLCVYALCIVESSESDRVSIANMQDAWTWIARFINWCRSNAKTHLEEYVIDIFNVFLRVVSPKMKMYYGKPYEILLKSAILETVIPLVKKKEDRDGNIVDNKLSEFLREFENGSTLSLFN